MEEAPDEDPRSPPKTACIMEHPEEDPERMFSVRALKHSPPTRVKSPLAEEASPPEATTSSAEEEPVSDSGLEDSENRPPVLVKTPGSGFAEGFHTSVRIAEEGPSGGSTPRSVNRLPSPVADAETPEREAAECFHTVGSMSEDEVSSSSTTASENGDPLRGAESPASSREKEEGIHTASLRGAERSSEDSVKGVHNGVGSGSESKRERDPSDFGSESKLRSSDSRDEHVLRTAGKALGPNGDQLSDSCRPGGYRSGCSESTGQEQATEVSALQFEESSHIGTALLDEQSPDMGEERGRKKWVSDAGKSEPRRTGEGQETSAGCGELEGLCSSVAEASDLCQQGNLPVSSGEPVVEEGTDESEPRQTQEGNKPGTEDGRGQLVQLRVSGLEASGLCRAGGSSGKTAVEMGTDESKCLGTQTENTVDFEENIGLLAKREGAAGKGSLESSDCVTERDPTLRSEQPPTKSAVKEQPKPHDSPVVHSYQQGKLGSGLLTESRNQEASDSASEISVKMSKLGKEAKKKRKARVVDLGP